MRKLFSKNKRQKGYAILFTVIVVSAISVITAGLTNAAYKQLILSSLAKDSQVAFYQADTASDCALYADRVESLKTPTNVITTGGAWSCGGTNMNVVLKTPATDGYDILPVDQNSQNSCFRIEVAKSTTGGTPTWQSGLISWWKFDGDATDSRGSNNGTEEGSVSLTNTNCKSGQCYTFDPSSGGQISVPDSASLDLPTSYTISAWVYPTDVASWHTIVAKGSDPSVANYAWQIGNGISILEDGYDTTFWARSASPSYSTNTMYFVTAVADSATSHLKLYINGVEHIYTTQTWGGAPKTNNNPLIIGGSQAWGEWFQGNIDEVMIWDRALSTTEIQAVRDSFDASPATITTKISAKGYNICNKTNLRTVEREIEVNYEE